jgi:hypothetical protein
VDQVHIGRPGLAASFRGQLWSRADLPYANTGSAQASFLQRGLALCQHRELALIPSRAGGSPKLVDVGGHSRAYKRDSRSILYNISLNNSVLIDYCRRTTKSPESDSNLTSMLLNVAR